VQAGAKSPGKGTKRAPFATLARVQARSRAGDRIIVLPAPRSTPPLGGGIRLKRRQQLIGAGPAVGTAATRERAPRLTNTTSALSGDAIRLATGSTVRNLEISGTRRGGIYGVNVDNVSVTGNDISRHNTSCTPGFLIPPFNVPTILTGVAVPISAGLKNGWAGIMIDADRGISRVTIRGNGVHGADCGDGIDLRASGTGGMRASITGNDVRELREGESLESILAIGLQTRDHAGLVATVDGNTQAGLGNDEDFGVGPSGADSEGVFVNPAGPSSMRVTVSRNTYTHTRGRSGFSANGLEYVSMGDGSQAEVTVKDSRFSGTPGDVLEQLALGTNARLALTLDRVTATRSTGFGGSGIGDTVVIPGNNADCLVAASGGAGNTIETVIRKSELTDCANNGVTFGSSVANGTGPTKAMHLEISDSNISGNHDGNLRVGNISALGTLTVKVEGTNLSNAGGIGSTVANVAVEDLGSTRESIIDFGGGALGSLGANCLGGGLLSFALLGYDASVQDNWWGDDAGALLGRTLAIGGNLDTSHPLRGAPESC
jgi:hypothetical protein